MVGIGTIGDIVPLIDENRTLAKYGLRALNISRRKGLVQLLLGIGLEQGHILSEHVSYAVDPHLNASGRPEDAKIAARLMMEKDDDRINAGVNKLIQYNCQRKKLQNEAYEACRLIVERECREDLFYVICLEDAHEGITGIVAGKIKDTFNRPAIIVTPTGDGCLKGTGRSIEGVNLYRLLKANEALFERFGGHAAACGFTMKKDGLPLLRANLNEAMRRIAEDNPNLFNRRPEAELELSTEDVCRELAEEINRLEPFGRENPQPLVQVRVRPVSVRTMGSQGQYIRFSGVLDDGREIPCVIFKDAHEYDEILQRGQKISIIGTLGLQSWNGRQYLQINVSGVEE